MNTHCERGEFQEHVTSTSTSVHDFLSIPFKIDTSQSVTESKYCDYSITIQYIFKPGSQFI